MFNCPDCGSDVQMGVEICPTCGYRLSRQVREEEDNESLVARLRGSKIFRVSLIIVCFLVLILFVNQIIGSRVAGNLEADINRVAPEMEYSNIEVNPLFQKIVVSDVRVMGSPYIRADRMDINKFNNLLDPEPGSFTAEAKVSGMRIYPAEFEGAVSFEDLDYNVTAYLTQELFELLEDEDLAEGDRKDKIKEELKVIMTGEDWNNSFSARGISLRGDYAVDFFAETGEGDVSCTEDIYNMNFTFSDMSLNGLGGGSSMMAGELKTNYNIAENILLEEENVTPEWDMTLNASDIRLDTGDNFPGAARFAVSFLAGNDILKEMRINELSQTASYRDSSMQSNFNVDSTLGDFLFNMQLSSLRPLSGEDDLGYVDNFEVRISDLHSGLEMFLEEMIKNEEEDVKLKKEGNEYVYRESGVEFEELFGEDER